MGFERELIQFCGVASYNSFQHDCAFLILDQAELLLSLALTSFHDKTPLDITSQLNSDRHH